MTSIYPSTTSTAATSSTASSSILRISGMASGIDTDAVVKSMVSNYQVKIDKANQDKQTLAWQQDSYREIITGIKGLQEYFDPLSDKYMLTGNSLNINSVTNSDSTIVSGTVSSSAKPGTYKVSVKQLAEQAKISGSSLNTMIAVPETVTTTGDSTVVSSLWSGATFTLGSKSIKLDAIEDTNSNGTTVDEVVANINSKIAADSTLNGTVSASYVSDGTTNYIKFTKSDSTSASIALPVNATLGIAATTINSGVSSSSLLTSLGFSSGGTASFTLKNGSTSYPVSLAVDSTTTIQDLMNSVNSTTSGAITMSLDDTTGKLTFQSKASGSSSNITISDTTAGVLSKLGITAGSDSGVDAIVAITAPGATAATTTTQSSNRFTVNGVSYSLVGVNTTETPTSTVNVTADSDTVVTNIKSFIKDYNTIISTINTKLTEKKDSDYPPLTDTQKAAMSDTQIAAWETKAKVGVLRNDDYLSTLMTQLRGTLYSPVYSDSTNASTGKISLNFGGYGTGAIGIQTSTDATDGGKLVITDETKLKDAIENHLDDFKSLFIGDSSSTLATNETYIGSDKYKEDGIFKRMDTIIRDYVGSPGVGEDGTYTLNGYMNIFVNKQYDFSTTGSSSQNTLPDQVYKKTLSITALQTQMEAASTRYYAKFTALETAMNTLNTQQSSLTAMLGTSTSS